MKNSISNNNEKLNVKTEIMKTKTTNENLVNSSNQPQNHKKEIKKIKLVNTIEMNEIHPDTFHLPPKKELNNLNIGDIVKVSCNHERFWCVVDDFITDDLLVGVIDNELIFDDGYGLDDKILIHTNNIFEVFDSVRYELELMDTKTNGNSMINSNQQEQTQIINKLKPNKMETTNGNIMTTTEIKINKVEQFKNYLDETLSELYEERKSLQEDIDERFHLLNINVMLDDEDISRIEEEIYNIEEEIVSIDNMIGVIDDLERKIDSTNNEFNEYGWVL